MMRTQKALRVCLVRDGQVVEEQRVTAGTRITIGNSPSNLFVVNEPALPKTHELFRPRMFGGFDLALVESMRGSISLGTSIVDFSTLAAQGLLKKKSGNYHLKLHENHRGKITAGNTTIIFQFLAHVPDVSRAKLPKSARTSVWQFMEPHFAGILVAMMLIEVPIILYFQTLPKPKPLTIEKLGDRYLKILMPDLKKAKTSVADKKAKEDNKIAQRKAPEGELTKTEQKEAKETDTDRSAAAKQKSAKIRSTIAGKGLLSFIGARASSSGAVAEVFSSGGLSAYNLQNAFDKTNTGQGMIGAAGGDRIGRGGGIGKSTGIASVSTAGGGQVGLAAKTEAKVTQVKTEEPDVSGSLDGNAVAQVVQRRMRSVQDCYEQELKRDPKLSGKIEIEFTIGSEGQVTDATVANNRMESNAVASCIVGRIRRWRFPKPEGGTVTVTFPFIFTSSN